MNEKVNNRTHRGIIKWDGSCYANGVVYGGILTPPDHSVFSFFLPPILEATQKLDLQEITL